MTSYDKEKKLDYDHLLEKLQSLEKRLTTIESMLRIEWINKEGEQSLESVSDNNTEDAESKIVEYGLAWLGTIVLSFGIIFLMSFLDSKNLVISSRVIAYLSSFIIIAFIYFQRRSFPILVNVLTICTPLLLYYITLNLHFFSDSPIVSNKAIELGLLIILIGVQFVLAIRRNSEFLGSLGILLCSTTAIFIDSTYITFIILAATSVIALVLFYQKLWWRILLFSLFVVYLTHLIWLFNNPIMGNPLHVVDSPQNNVWFLFTYGIIYASTIFISKEKLETNGVLISMAVWNALLFTFLLFMILLAFYKENYAWICSAIALFCISFSVILKLRSVRNFAPATYACFGFMALSMAVYGFIGLPETYFLLVLQSFLVVSMALWFRSRIIVVANSFLFVTILLIYLLTSETTDLINFTFAITAIATARILNWRKERLTLKTEVFRNIFLAIAFIMILYALSHALPEQYVTLSWTATAISFFILSIILKNIKYRYLSILTIVVTGGHLFFIDLNKMEIGYRVIAF